VDAEEKASKVTINEQLAEEFFACFSKKIA
jgi:hypothetical protein